ncbi:hypothetical protein LXL04_023234 [Taraxacum kok-saghyz]
MEIMKATLQQKLSEITKTIAAKVGEIGCVCNITANPIVDNLKRSIIDIWELPLQEKWNQTRSIHSNTNMETLKQLPFAVWDMCVGVFEQAFLLYQKRDRLIQHCFDAAQPYLTAEYLQNKWNQIYLFLSSESQIGHWLYVAALCLLAYFGLHLCLLCFSYFFMFISSVVIFLFWVVTFIAKLCIYLVFAIFQCFASVVSLLFMFISSVVIFLFWVVTSIFKVCCYVAFPIFRCFCFGGKSAVKLMKAPGRPTMMIARAVFEANPKGYFANLRGKV